MRILLDESLPKELQSEIPGHDIRTVQEEGWSSLKNGELLTRSVNKFDVFLTADQNLRYQQNLSSLPVAVIVLVAKSNRIEELRPLIPALLTSLAGLQPRTLGKSVANPRFDPVPLRRASPAYAGGSTAMC